MSQMVYYSLEYFLCVIEFCVLYIFFSQLFDKKSTASIAKVGFILTASIAVFLKGFFKFNMGYEVIYSLFVLLLYVCLQFKVELKQSIIYVGFYTVCVWLCDLAVVSIYSLIYSHKVILQIQEFHRLRYNIAIVSKLCCFSILILLSDKEIIHSRNRKALTKTSGIALVITAIMSLVSLYGLYIILQYSLEGSKNSNIDFIVCIVSISIFLIDIIVYASVKLINESIEKEKEYEFIQYQNELLVKSIEDNQTVSDEWHRIRHDFNNHMSCIDMLLQMENIEKARNYIQKLTKFSEMQTVGVCVGNTIADAVIRQKLILAKQHQINMEIKGEISSKLQMEEPDLCALMSNSLDNAIEATCQIEDIAKRKIQLTITEKAHELFIQVSNNVKEDIGQQKVLITTKKDTKRHGVGMRSMHITVEKYKGHLSWQCKEKVFTLNIVLPI